MIVRSLARLLLAVILYPADFAGANPVSRLARTARVSASIALAPNCPPNTVGSAAFLPFRPVSAGKK